MTRSPASLTPSTETTLVAVDVDAVDLDAEVNFAAALANQFGHVFPKLAGAELGIKKLFDQRGLGLLLRNVAGALSGQRSS